MKENPDKSSHTERDTKAALLDLLEKQNPEIGEMIEKDPALKGDLLKNEELLSRLAFSIQTRSTMVRSGPFPPAEEMILVEEKHAGYIAHLMAVHKQSIDTRSDLSNKAMNFKFYERIVSQLSGLTLGILSLVLAGYLGINGHDVLGGVIGGTTVIALVTVFVTGREYKPKSSKKNQSLAKDNQPPTEKDDSTDV
ncbi:hypothetical protein EBI01_20250 [Marinomonas rhizomae]|uniref:DUF2335 domain-containing protein n=1 Tax=Marinomonas rhizomae TaxID=491948 RepID=A0A366IY42_9GAMM|nr:hypothetical protein [Marinomonas rhizomae]RBP79090.1 hypothetical protein DFP80_11520 [Marinomonas rhizomae]RNF68569.1 hypothetical protein EBI01_20250 [Marinomonas rhizomae]